MYPRALISEADLVCVCVCVCVLCMYDFLWEGTGDNKWVKFSNLAFLSCQSIVQ